MFFRSVFVISLALKTPNSFQSAFGRVIALAVLYFFAARLGLEFSVIGENVTLIWPATGLSLAALLLFGYRLWPGVALGAFLVNLTTGVPLATAMGMAVGNTLEAVAGAYLLNHFSAHKFSLDRIRDVLLLIFLGSGVSTMVSATFGALSLALGGIVPWDGFTRDVARMVDGRRDGQSRIRASDSPMGKHDARASLCLENIGSDIARSLPDRPGTAGVR